MTLLTSPTSGSKSKFAKLNAATDSEELEICSLRAQDYAKWMPSDQVELDDDGELAKR
jgi:hypothetical protein